MQRTVESDLTPAWWQAGGQRPERDEPRTKEAEEVGETVERHESPEEFRSRDSLEQESFEQESLEQDRPRGGPPTRVERPLASPDRPSGTALSLVFVASVLIVGAAFVFTRYGLPWQFGSSRTTTGTVAAAQAQPQVVDPPPLESDEPTPTPTSTSGRAEVGPGYDDYTRATGGQGINVGFGLSAVTPSSGCKKDEPCVRGALITKVTKGSVGARTGLRVGDEIVTVGESTVEDSNDLIRAITAARPGTRLALVFLRDGTLRLGALQVPRS